MILCDFDDLNKEDFHLKFYESIVRGNIELIKEILQHPKLSKNFDISHKNYHCIIASILNSQQPNDCHLELLQLFTSSPLLKKHANPSLCNKDDVFGGALGNAIIFGNIETVRLIGKYFDENTPNLQDIIGLSIFNNRKDAFFYLLNDRKFSIKKPDIILKAMDKFPQIDKDIVQFIKNLNSPSENKNDDKSLQVKNKNTSKNKSSNPDSFLINIAQPLDNDSQNFWGSKFRQNF